MGFFFGHPIYYPRTTLVLPPSSDSDPRAHSGRSSPLPTTVGAFIVIARIIQHFLPSSTRVELYLPTLLGALSSYPILFTFRNNRQNLTTVGIELKDKQT